MKPKPSAAAFPPAAQGSHSPDASGTLPQRLSSLFALVLWVSCLAAGTIGLKIGYPRSAPPALEFQTQLIHVELPQDLAPPPTPQSVASPDSPVLSSELTTPVPAAPSPVALPAAPAITPVAAPSAAVAFAVPTAGLTRIVEVSQAAHGAPPSPATTLGSAGGAGTLPPLPSAPPIVAPTIAPPPTPLTLGVGEGRQPPPEYPRDAILARQEGTVRLRFQVDQTGRVSNVEVLSPARWPLLNQAAIRAIRDTWRFPPGSVRTYEVPIQFQLSRNSP